MTGQAAELVEMELGELGQSGFTASGQPQAHDPPIVLIGNPRDQPGVGGPSGQLDRAVVPQV